LLPCKGIRKVTQLDSPILMILIIELVVYTLTSQTIHSFIGPSQCQTNLTTPYALRLAQLPSTPPLIVSLIASSRLAK